MIIRGARAVLKIGVPLLFLTGIMSAQGTIGITTSDLPPATFGQAYSFTLTATGGRPPYTWSADSSPASLSLNPNGILAGSPNTSGTFSITVKVTDFSQNSAVKVFQFTILGAGGSNVSITTSSPLPAGTAGLPYSQTFSATGGQPPYKWGSAGTIPAGLTINTTNGVLSGTPASLGSFSFTIQVSDNAGVVGTKSFSLTIKAPPLIITTDTLFNGTVGLPYSQTLVASGGVPPYRWSFTTGQAGIISLDQSTGAMTGTPQSSGIFDFTVQVTDSTGVTASKSLTLVVDLPKLTITTATPLPGGPVGTAYSQKFSAIGGTAPYTWVLAAGFIPGLSVDFIGGVLSGTPTDSGTFNFSVQATDSKGQTGTKAFSITITPGPPSITTDAQLPDGTFGVPFLQAIQAIGGIAPYVWSASRLPDGLNLDSATGIISGTPQTAGTFAFTITLTDSARSSSTARFNLTIGLPPLPTLNISGLPATANAADQLKAHLELSSPYPAPVSGQLLLTFVSDVGGNDGTIQFSTGGRTAAFTIPANTTAATPDLSIQTGTVAGTIRLVAQFQSFGIDITPSPAPTVTMRVNPAAPTIVSTKLVRTTNGFSIQVTGYSTSREVTQAVFHFTAASGNTLQSGDVAVSVQSMFAQWFQDATSTAFGSQFTFTQPFTVQGDSNAVIPGSITLTNSLGSNTANIAQ